MTKEELQKEIELLVGKREQQIRDLGLTDGAIQTIAYFIKKMDGTDAPAEVTGNE